MACGRPVLAAAAGETARIVLEAGAGWTVKPGDSIGLVNALRQAHAMGHVGLGSLGAAARSYYERENSQPTAGSTPMNC